MPKLLRRVIFIILVSALAACGPAPKAADAPSVSVQGAPGPAVLTATPTPAPSKTNPPATSTPQPTATTKPTITHTRTPIFTRTITPTPTERPTLVPIPQAILAQLDLVGGYGFAGNERGIFLVISFQDQEFNFALMKLIGEKWQWTYEDMGQLYDPETGVFDIDTALSIYQIQVVTEEKDGKPVKYLDKDEFASFTKAAHLTWYMNGRDVLSGDADFRMEQEDDPATPTRGTAITVSTLAGEASDWRVFAAARADDAILAAIGTKLGVIYVLFSADSGYRWLEDRDTCQEWLRYLAAEKHDKDSLLFHALGSDQINPGFDLQQGKIDAAVFDTVLFPFYRGLSASGLVADPADLQKALLAGDQQNALFERVKGKIFVLYDASSVALNSAPR